MADPANDEARARVKHDRLATTYGIGTERVRELVANRPPVERTSRMTTLAYVCFIAAAVLTIISVWWWVAFGADTDLYVAVCVTDVILVGAGLGLLWR